MFVCPALFSTLGWLLLSMLLRRCPRLVQIPLSEATSRLAVVDLDWTHIRAVDILSVLRSFLPKAGAITRVTVYPSDYGLARMAEEATAGPKVRICGGVASLFPAATVAVV